MKAICTTTYFSLYDHIVHYSPWIWQASTAQLSVSYITMLSTASSFGDIRRLGIFAVVSAATLLMWRTMSHSSSDNIIYSPSNVITADKNIATLDKHLSQNDWPQHTECKHMNSYILAAWCWPELTNLTILLIVALVCPQGRTGSAIMKWSNEPNLLRLVLQLEDPALSHIFADGHVENSFLRRSRLFEMTLQVPLGR